MTIEGTYGRDQKGRAERRHYVALDGYRGLLAICVAIYHTYWLSNVNSSAFFNNGPVLIDLFFVFSGFLMFTLYGAMGSAAEVRAFFVKRIARLYPVHLAMTLAVLAFAIVRIVAHQTGVSSLDPGEVLPFSPGASETLPSLLSNLVLIQSLGLHDSLTYNVPAWTVSVEMAAYIVFAAMCLWARPTKTGHFVLIGLAVAGIYLWLSRVKPDMDITHDLGFWRCLAGFYTGVLCARISPMFEGAFAKMSRLSGTVIELATALAFASFVIWLPGKAQFFVGAFALIFVCVFAQDRGAVSALMGRPLFRYFAKISYALYMVHFLIAVVFGMAASRILPSVFGEGWNATGLGGDLLLIPYVIATIIGAHILHVCVEVPGARIVRGLLSRRRAHPLPST